MKESRCIKPLSAKVTKWSNTLKQFVGMPTNCLSVFDHFVGLALEGLIMHSPSIKGPLSQSLRV